jgi:Sigma-70 region 2
VTMSRAEHERSRAPVGFERAIHDNPSRFPGRAGPRRAGPPPEKPHREGRQRMDNQRGAQFTGRVTAHPARDGTLVTDLVTRARTGDKLAWDALVERYAPLIWSVCGRYRLSRADAEDAGQSVWLHLAGQLDKIRDPAALPGWLATTSREPPGPAGWHGRPGTARGRAARGAARRSQPVAARRPAADRLAHRRPAGPLRRNQHQARHPRRQHRPEPQPMPGQATP